MPSFKDAAFEILSKNGSPLHSDKITEIALSKGLIQSDGKTPKATMNAQLIVDVNKKGLKSRFIKTGPSTFYVNQNVSEVSTDKLDSDDTKKKVAIVSKVSSKQKGDISEARIAELITLYGDNEISCFKPISDDEGIDLIVKPKGQLKSLYLQVKSRFGDNPAEIYTATVKSSGIVNNYSMGFIFCYFDTAEGDLWDYLWFVPAPAFLDMANKLQGGASLGFVSGRKKSESNKWDSYMISKTDLSQEIINQLNKIS